LQRFAFTRSSLTTELKAIVEREVDRCAVASTADVYDTAATSIRTAYYLALALGYFTTPDPRGTCETMIEDALLLCRRAYVNGINAEKGAA
jgi:hypothetical protein